MYVASPQRRRLNSQTVSDNPTATATSSAVHIQDPATPADRSNAPPQVARNDDHGHSSVLSVITA